MSQSLSLRINENETELQEIKQPEFNTNKMDNEIQFDYYKEIVHDLCCNCNWCGAGFICWIFCCPFMLIFCPCYICHRPKEIRSKKLIIVNDNTLEYKQGSYHNQYRCFSKWSEDKYNSSIELNDIEVIHMKKTNCCCDKTFVKVITKKKTKTFYYILYPEETAKLILSLTEEEINNKNEEIIRQLKLEIARIKTDIYKNEQMAKLKRKNNALEERLIKARSEKAKMLPNLLREKTELKSKLVENKKLLALHIVKWKFVEKKYIKQIRDYTQDLERYARKLDNQIKGKRKLGNQMEMLDKIAQDTVLILKHQRVISSMNGDEKNTLPEKDTLPENLKRVQNVIQDLTNKLHTKQIRITELENKLALFEYSISRTSMINTTTNTEYNMFNAFSSTMTDLTNNNNNNIPDKLQLSMIQNSSIMTEPIQS
eukprot:170000_1